MRTKRLIRILPWVFLLYTLHITLYTSIAFCASKGKGPVAYWRFDEGGGASAYDQGWVDTDSDGIKDTGEAWSNNTGTLTPGAGANTAAGQMWTRQGKVGGALECDGTDDYVNVSSNMGIGATTNFTVSGWLKLNSTKNNQVMAIENPSGGYPWSLGGLGYSITNHNGTSGRFNFCSYHTSTGWVALNSSIVPQTGVWYYLTAIYEVISGTQANRKLYVNGQLEASDTYSPGATAAWGTPVYIGEWHGNPGMQSVVDGLIDDVRIYDYARTADQIMVDYNAGMATYSGAGTDPNEGNPPVGYWKFDENTGTTAYDRSGNGNNGTLTNGPTWTQGKYGTALSFDGSNDYVGFSKINALEGSADYTIAAWIKTTAAQNGGVVGQFDIGNHIIAIFIGSDSVASFVTYEGGYSNVSSNTTVNSGQWRYIAIVKSGTMGRIYIDGVEKNSGTVKNVTSTTEIRIGTRENGAYPFNGLIDDVKIYNYARTQAQIAYDYNKGTPVAHYKFDEGGGSIAHSAESRADEGAAPVGWWRMDNNWNDSSGNGNNGTANGIAAFSTTAKIGPYSGTFASGDYVDCGNNALLRFPSTSKFTVEAWFRPTTVDGNWRSIVGKGANDSNEEICLLFNSTNIYFDWGGGSGYVQNNGSLITANNWYHIVAVYDASAAYSPNNTQGSVYLNGGLISRDAGGNSPHIEDSSSNLRFGVTRGATMPFIGQIDDVRIYNYARTAEQIYNDYKTTHGTLVNGAKFIDGKIGKALQFNGSNDYVVIPDNDNLNITGGVTMSAWVYFNGEGTGNHPILAKQNPTNLQYAIGRYLSGGGNSHKFFAGFFTGSWTDYVSDYVLNDATWYHVAATFDGTNVKLYVNGALNKTIAAGTSSLTGGSGLLHIGADNYNHAASPHEYLNGKLDDVRIYNYSRTADQIMQDYNAGTALHTGASTGTADPWSGALPVGWWKLDENTGVKAYDASGNNNDGTLTNGPTWTQGKNGPALSFDGTNDYVNTSNTAYLVPWASGFSIAFWMKPSTGNIRDTYIIGKYHESWCFRNLDNATQWGFSFNNIDATVTVPYDTWTHVVATYDGNIARTYKNGVFSNSATVGAYSANGNNLRPGTRGIDFYAYYRGSIDDIRIYNYVRTQAQIAWDYNKGKPVGYWRFDEGSGTTAYDESDNNNDGTISGATWSTSGKFGKCLSFNGNASVSAADSASLDFTGAFSMSYWAKFNSVSSEQWLVSKGGGWYRAGFFSTIGISSGTLRFGMGNGSGEVTADNSGFTTGTWYHIVMTYDGTTMRVYKDGVLLPNTNTNSYSYVNNYTVNIGRSDNGGQLAFSGLIDDVRIYNYARTTDQILQDFNAGMAAKTSGD